MMSENQSSNVAQLPDGWKMYDKYQIRHTDGTPLKGKNYFVLRLDSDNPVEAARVAAAMHAYKGELSTGNGAKMREVVELLARVILPPQEEYPAEYGGGKVPDKDGWLAWIRQVQSYAKSALAEPRRNCDVGTAMEQGERFSAYCQAHKHSESECLHCPLFGQTGGYCELAWAQMPHEEGGVK